MKNKFDNFLLIMLWLLAVCLGTSFWLNTKFGFNMFSGDHWKYLSYAQASNQNINIWFYVSLAIAIASAILGIYILIQPSFHEITKRRKNIAINKSITQTTISQPASVVSVAQPQTTNIPVRPPHIPPTNTVVTPIHHDIQPIQQAVKTSPHTSEIGQIFTDAEYDVKNAPIINGIQTSLLAAGTGEVVYIGAESITTDDMQKIVDKLSKVFTDTLDDIEIQIIPFVVEPKNTTNENILTFSDLSQLANYMQTHTNPPISEDDNGDFDAFSSYITTVGEYIGNI